MIAPTQVNILLRETETQFLLNIPGCTAFKCTDEGEAAEKDNISYYFRSVGKGRHVKMRDAAIQTLPILVKTRGCESTKTYFGTNWTFVSNWEMYDTYKNNVSVPKISVDQDDDDEHKLIDSLPTDINTFDKQIHDLVNNKKFRDSLQIIERLLANNCYNEQQMQYKGLISSDLYQQKQDYKYELKLLWTFANDDTKGKCVVGISFNRFNDDILAVGYGKYYFEENKPGIVMVWNIKNPVQPERQYNFTVSVTCLAFSKMNPNLLAIGLHTGMFKVMDVSQRHNNIVMEDSPSFEVIWQVVWHYTEDGGNEKLLVSCGDGKIFHYTLDLEFGLKPVQIMRTYKSEGRLDGIREGRPPLNREKQIVSYSPARVIALHPTNKIIYYIGTSEGVLYKCSMVYMNRYLNLLKVHMGSFHRITHSPLVNKVFMTVGDDFASRIWVDGVPAPLITFKLSITSVNDGDWCPTHSTIIVTIREENIVIWDLQRKIYEPQNKIKMESCNVICRFTPNGRCLMVGDIDGNVHVFSLEGLPRPAFFQENLFQQSLKRALLTKPDLLRRLSKVGSLNYERGHNAKM